MDLTSLVQGGASGALLASLYVLVALGLTIEFSLLRIINFAHGDFYMLGAVAAYYLFAEVALPFPLVVVVAAVGGVILGFLAERTLFRRFHEDLLGAFVLSLGLAWVLEMAVVGKFGAYPKGLPPVVAGVSRFGQVAISNDRIMVIVVGSLIVAAISLYVTKSQVGRAMRAVAQNKDAAALLGINPVFVGTIGFVLGTALATLAGALVSPIFSVDPQMGVGLTIKAFVIVIIGGMGSIPGAVLAGILLGLFEGVGGIYVDNAQLAVLEFLVIILFLILRPKGIMGSAEA